MVLTGVVEEIADDWEEYEVAVPVDEYEAPGDAPYDVISDSYDVIGDDPYDVIGDDSGDEYCPP